MSLSEWNAASEPLSAAELDVRLERAVHDHERSEKLICIYLHQIHRRRLHQNFGFENVYDYALERFGFSRTKTGALLFLATRLCRLPKLTEALATGRIGWTKAAKVASVASEETDVEWTEKAVTSTYRDLEREIRDGINPKGGNVTIWLTAEQAAIWARAIETCRRVTGEQISTGKCLEFSASELLSTYEAVAEEPASPDDLSTPIEEPAENVLCPETDGEIPVPTARCYAEIHKQVLERDGYVCQYPGCHVRRGLHVHHVKRRSAFGTKTLPGMNATTNLIVSCWFHHRLIHAGIIGVTGCAPDGLEWRRPPLMESVTERHERLSPIDPDFLADPDMIPDGSQRWDLDADERRRPAH